MIPLAVFACAGPEVVDPDPDPAAELTVSCAPTGNPLRFGCEVRVDPPQAVVVRHRRSDGLGPERDRAADRSAAVHSVPLLFLAPRQAYTVEAWAAARPDLPVTTTVTTGLAPEHVASWLVTTSGGASTPWLGTEDPCASDAVAVIYDTDTGALVWYQDLDERGNLGPQDMVRYTERRTVLGETGGALVEVDLEGRDLWRLAVTESYHHDVFEHDGGTYLLTQEQEDDGVLLDELVVLERDGAERWRWRAADHLPIPADAEGDWLHLNAVFVEPGGDFYLSSLTQDGIGRFDGDPASPTFGEPRWWWSGGTPPGPLGTDLAADWSRVSGPDGFGDPHQVNVRPDGRLQLLDNANGRGLLVAVDEAAGLARVDAAWPTPEDRCGAQGTSTVDAAGNALVACSDDRLRQFDGETGELRWEARVVCRNGQKARAARWYPLDGW